MSQMKKKWHEIVHKCDHRGNKERDRKEEIRDYLLGLVSAVIKINSKHKQDFKNNYFSC